MNPEDVIKDPVHLVAYKPDGGRDLKNVVCGSKRWRRSDGDPRMVTCRKCAALAGPSGNTEGERG